MVAGALRDSGQISGAGDLKADTHVCRVLGRSVVGKLVDAETAAQLARQMHPDPWHLDWPLWNLGRDYCHPNHPNCTACYLMAYCACTRNLTETEPNATVLPVTKIATEICITDEEAKAVEYFSDNEKGYLDWIAVNPTGYVMNCYKASGPYMLHRSDCYTIRNNKHFTTGQYSKACSNNKEEVTIWAKQELKKRGLPESGFQRCTRCNP